LKEAVALADFPGRFHRVSKGDQTVGDALDVLERLGLAENKMSTKSRRYIAVALVFATLTGAKAEAQGWTADVWKPYTDKFGMIHTTKVGADGNPASNNGLLYTAEACTIMQLQGVSYDRSRIASGLAAYQIMPGLFKRAPANVVDQEAPDDWVGLGALAGVCGYHDVAQGILDYGTHQGATSSSVVTGMNLPGLGNITNLIQQCTTVPI
jgi:hypothetical protein